MVEEIITTHFNDGMVFLLQQNPKYRSSRLTCTAAIIPRCALVCLRFSFFPPLDPLQFFRNRMNATAGIEPDNDLLTPVGRQRELNPFNSALPAPSPAEPGGPVRRRTVQRPPRREESIRIQSSLLEWAAVEQPVRISGRGSVMRSTK